MVLGLKEVQVQLNKFYLFTFFAVKTAKVRKNTKHLRLGMILCIEIYLVPCENI